jgi:hypothetical protein
VKAITVTLVAALGLAGCHTHRSKETPPAAPASGASPTAAKTDKALEKSRDAMLGKDMDIGNQHWATSPAATSTATSTATATTTTAAPGAATPSAATGPAAASSAPRTSGR